MSIFKKLFGNKNKENSVVNHESGSDLREELSIIQERPDGNIELENDIRKQLINDEKKIMLAQVKTFMTSHQGADAENAFRTAGIMDDSLKEEVLKQYTWHYLDDIDENLQCTMQLVLTEVLEKTKPFTDSRDIYEKLLGVKYKGFDE
ncbi:hypothetical protein [Dokdonia sp.]|uniref:hypothetical protein n=1 Tax=Dokdonia sp. TaxID=2024995 RepID=UPI003265C9F6